jgi:hypothetical protein
MDCVATLYRCILLKLILRDGLCCHTLQVYSSEIKSLKSNVTKYDKILTRKACSVCSHQYGTVRCIHNHTVFIWLIILLKRISFFVLLFEPLVFSGNGNDLLDTMLSCIVISCVILS